jgi:hypothetical protein
MFLRHAPLLFFVLLGAGCEREKIRVYVAPKDPALQAEPERQPPSQVAPQLAWNAPPHWQQTESGQVSVANFVIRKEGREASVNITPLPNLAGREAMIVNMWREQMGQPALTEDEVSAALLPAEVAGETGRLFEIGGSGAERTIVTAFLHRSDASWFFKLAGDAALVAEEKPRFLEFIKTVRMKETAPPSSSGETPANFAWQIPEGWNSLPPGQMQVAKFALPSKDGASGEVSVSIFPNDTGGILANINRWRKQIGLGEVDEAALASVVAPLPNVDGAFLVELANGNRKLLGAIVPRDAQWFFYKMLGDKEAVDAEQAAFVKFASSKP